MRISSRNRVSFSHRSVGRCRSTSHCRKIAHSSSRNQRWNCFRLIRNCSKNIDRYPSHVVDVVGFDVVVECLHYFHYSKVVFHTKAAPSNVDVECASSVVAQRSNISHSHNICFCSASVFFPPFHFAFGSAFVHNESHVFILCGNRFPQMLRIKSFRNTRAAWQCKTHAHNRQ